MTMFRTSVPATFPPLQARNLNGQTFTLPAAFVGTRNIVIVAFRRSHQALVDSWTPAVDHLLASHRDLQTYEVPMMASGYTLVRSFIDGGMANAIANSVVRERTLTIYTDVAKSCAAMQIDSQETITILLVDRNGMISWRSTGAYDPTKGAELEQALAAKNGSVLQ